METELSPEVTLKNTPAPKRSRESQSLPTIGSHRAVFFSPHHKYVHSSQGRCSDAAVQSDTSM